jgi:hypothetical protein
MEMSTNLENTHAHKKTYFTFVKTMGTHCDVSSEFDNEVQEEQQKRHR